MAGEYLSQLIQLEEALNENSGAFSDAISEQLAQTVNDMKGQQISVEEYLRSCSFANMSGSIIVTDSITAPSACCSFSMP